MISKTKIEQKLRRKTNPELVKTIILTKKNDNWLDVGNIISGPTRKLSKINLQDIDKKTKEGDTVVIPGKVLSKGDLTKKTRIVALSFSEKALEKMKHTKSEAVTIENEIKINPKAQGIKVIR